MMSLWVTSYDTQWFKKGCTIILLELILNWCILQALATLPHGAKALNHNSIILSDLIWRLPGLMLSQIDRYTYIYIYLWTQPIMPWPHSQMICLGIGSTSCKLWNHSNASFSDLAGGLTDFILNQIEACNTCSGPVPNHAKCMNCT